MDPKAISLDSLIKALLSAAEKDEGHPHPEE
jgi:hypothetical protein